MLNFELAKKRAERHAQRVKERQELMEIYHSNDKKSEKSIPTHKLIALYVFIVLTVILIYSMVAMWHFADLTYLGVLCGDMVGQLVNFSIYSKHSTMQNSAGGINYMALQEKLRQQDKEAVG